MKSLAISFVIVHYRAIKELFNCIRSIENSEIRLLYEIVVVDNDEIKSVEKELKHKYPKVKYLKSPKNIGYGSGNNLGEKASTGKYLYFINPDTLIQKGSVEKLVNFLEKNKIAGMVSPLILDKNNKPYRFQGTQTLTPLKSLVVYSFINKVFPENFISKRFWLKEWDKKNVKEVAALPGTALMISRKLFNRINGFDEKFFLFFEEYDLCKRIISAGYKCFIVPESKIIHFWGKSYIKSRKINNIFETSRFLYFKKYYGFIWAFVVGLLLKINITCIFFLFLIIIALFLRLYKLDQLMIFIGDQGWYYLSARDILLTGNIPLVGITASHTWLHQGALWTYLLAIMLKIFNFNPFSGAYLTIFLSISSVVLIYIAGKVLYSRKVGFFASLIYAFSPLEITYSRMPYHTSPIPILVILFIIFLHKLFTGKTKYFPLVILVLSLLYNFELATVILWLVLLFFIYYSLKQKLPRIKNAFSKKIIIISFFSFLFPMLPIVIYDFNNGFSQTIKFGLWIPYRIFLFFARIGISESIYSYKSLMSWILKFYNNLIFYPSFMISTLMLFIIVLWFSIHFIKSINSKKYLTSNLIIFSCIFIPLTGLFVNKIISDAYLPILLPSLILLTALFFSEFNNILKIKYTSYILLIFIVLTNLYYVVFYNYPIRYGPAFIKRFNASRSIIVKANGRKYNLVGKGQVVSEFKSFTMNYEYLTWWMGNAPSKNKEALKIYISEDSSGNVKIEN